MSRAASSAVWALIWLIRLLIRGIRAVWRGDRFLLETDAGETVFVKSLSGTLPAMLGHGLDSYILRAGRNKDLIASKAEK